MNTKTKYNTDEIARNMKKKKTIKCSTEIEVWGFITVHLTRNSITYCISLIKTQWPTCMA